MVLPYSRPDPALYNASLETVYSVTSLCAIEGLRIVPVQDIISVVSIQPHDYQVIPGEQRYFVWEYTGLDLGILGAEEYIDSK